MSPALWLVSAFLFGAAFGLALAWAGQPRQPRPLQTWRKGSDVRLSADAPGEGWAADHAPADPAARCAAVFQTLQLPGMTEQQVEQMTFNAACVALREYRCKVTFDGVRLVWIDNAVGVNRADLELQVNDLTEQLLAYAMRCIAVRCALIDAARRKA